MNIKLKITAMHNTLGASTMTLILATLFGRKYSFVEDGWRFKLKKWRDKSYMMKIERMRK